MKVCYVTLANISNALFILSQLVSLQIGPKCSYYSFWAYCGNIS